MAGRKTKWIDYGERMSTPRYCVNCGSKLTWDRAPQSDETNITHYITSFVSKCECGKHGIFKLKVYR